MLNSCMHSCSVQIQVMKASKGSGVIINMGSSAGLYPLFADPSYSASKGLVFMYKMQWTGLLGRGTVCIALLACHKEEEGELVIGEREEKVNQNSVNKGNRVTEDHAEY